MGRPQTASKMYSPLHVGGVASCLSCCVKTLPHLCPAPTPANTDTCSNSIRVVKTTKQTATVPMTYPQAVKVSARGRGGGAGSAPTYLPTLLVLLPPGCFPQRRWLDYLHMIFLNLDLVLLMRSWWLRRTASSGCLAAA